MTNVQTIEINALHAMTVLPRIALVFSRRRIALRRMELVADQYDGYAQIRMVAACDAESGRKLVRQLARIVEVRSAELRAGDGFAIEPGAGLELEALVAASAAG